MMASVIAITYVDHSAWFLISNYDLWQEYNVIPVGDYYGRHYGQNSDFLQKVSYFIYYGALNFTFHLLKLLLQFW